MDQRTRQQCSQRQVIDTNRSVETSLMDEFRQPGKCSEGFDIGSSSGVSIKGAFGKDLFVEAEDMRVAESGSRLQTPGCGDAVQTGSEVDFTEEICSQVKLEFYRVPRSKNENSGFRGIPTEEKVIRRSVESCGPEEHHAMEKDYVLSPESEELSYEQSDDDNLFDDISDTDFSDVEELDANDARSETSFAGSLDSVACGNVNAIAGHFSGGVKASRSDKLGAWGLIKLKTVSMDQKFCNVTNVADETQIYTTECTLENWTNSGGTDGQLVCETQKSQNDGSICDRSNFAQLEKELE